MMAEQLQSAENLPNAPTAGKSTKMPTVTPTTKSERLVALDALRGVATLGRYFFTVVLPADSRLPVPERRNAQQF